MKDPSAFAEGFFFFGTEEQLNRRRKGGERAKDRGKMKASFISFADEVICLVFGFWIWYMNKVSAINLPFA